jgi:hypothetical protein
MHADRTNRSMLTLLGLLTLAAGVGGLLASVGTFGQSFARRTLFDNGVSDFIGRHGDWFWAAAAVVCVLVALLTLRWLVALLFSTDRAGDLRVAGDRARGVTTIKPGAVTSALAAELNTYRGVDSAKARGIGASDSPTLAVTVNATGNADLSRLRRRIEAEAFAHVRQALDDPALRIQLDLSVASTTSSRVR